MVTIDRNTITPVQSLEDDGSYISTDDMQISLAHAMSLDHITRAFKIEIPGSAGWSTNAYGYLRFPEMKIQKVKNTRKKETNYE